MMNKPETKLPSQDSNPAPNSCKSMDEFESRFFPAWYEKQKTGLLALADEDSFGESLAKFGVEKHLKGKSAK